MGLPDLWRWEQSSTPTLSSNQVTGTSYNELFRQNLKSLPPEVLEQIAQPEQIVTEIITLARERHSIDAMASHLVQELMVKEHGPRDLIQLSRTIVFLLLGWKTMLYPGTFGNAPLSHFVLDDVLDGFPSHAYMTLKQDMYRVRQPLSDFLVGFGLMLPKENICLSIDKEDADAYEQLTVVRPEELNVALLWKLGKIRIQWIDVLAPHLEFDEDTGTLFLFRHPSYAWDHLPPAGEDAWDPGLIYSCASDEGASGQWANRAEVGQLLREILLSYRLLFGQSKSSRKLYRTLKIFDGLPSQCHDPLLTRLCNDRTSPLQTPDRDFYRLRRDFPILRERLIILHTQMASVKPRTWSELWRDKRDSAQWLTFWAVLVIGGLGLLLALIQVVQQGLQLGGTRRRR